MPQRRKDSPSLATDIGRDARVREVAEDVASRLAQVCATLPREEFVALVKQIATVTVKYEALAELHAARVATPPEPP